MLTNKQEAFLDQIIVDDRINKDRLFKYLGTHDIVGSEIFSFCIEDDEDPGRVKVSRFLADDDEFYQPLSVEAFIELSPFFFFIRDFHGKNQTYDYGDYCDLLSALFYRRRHSQDVQLKDIYSALKFAYYELEIPTDKIFGYWIDQTGLVTGDIFLQWIDYLHMSVAAGESDYFPKSFIYSYNDMLCKSGRKPIIYEITESGLGDPYFRDGLTFEFEGTFPCDPRGRPVWAWIGIHTNDIYNVTCSTKKSESGRLKFTVSPNTIIHVLNFYNHSEDDGDRWYQVYAGPQTMKFDYTILKERRTSMGLTQQQIADAVETSIRTYQKWESGETTPDGHYLLRLMNWLDIYNIQDAVKFISMTQRRNDR